jgi:DNA-binding phage protein
MIDHQPLDEFRMEYLRGNAADAAEYLRAALEEAAEFPAGVITAMSHVARARGGIEDLELTLDERAALANAIGRSLAHATPPFSAVLQAT